MTVTAGLKSCSGFHGIKKTSMDRNLKMLTYNDSDCRAEIMFWVSWHQEDFYGPKSKNANLNDSDCRAEIMFWVSWHQEDFYGPKSESANLQ